MKEKEFVHLHVHSEYSILDGVSHIDELIERAKELGFKAIALTDHGNMFGFVEFYKHAIENGIKPLIGMEAYVAGKSMLEKKGPDNPTYHLTLIALNNEGLKNLMYLSSQAFIKGFSYKPRIDKEILASHSKGLVALSGCVQGEIAQNLLANNREGAKKALDDYVQIFGKDNFFLELQNVGIEENFIVNQGLLELSRETGVKVVATNDVHFIRREDRELQDILIAINTGKKLSDTRRLKAETDLIYLRSAEEMWELFGEIPQALLNTVEIAERGEISLVLDASKVHLPGFEIPQKYKDAFEYLKHLAYQGLYKRFAGNVPERYLQRLKSELEIIQKMGYAGYFLIIWDLVHSAHRMGIPVGPGRGSAVGSLVLYALGITEVDPLKYNLIFERFLNPERVSPPDVDIDIADIYRDKLIAYVRKKYGDENVSQIITFGRMMAKGALRDVARVLGLPYSEADMIASRLPDGMSIKEALEVSPELKEIYNRGGVYKKLFDYAMRLEGQIRNTSIHAAGVVVAPGKLYEYVPLFRTKDEQTSTQVDMKSLELLGLMKIDLLGLRTLTIIKKTEELVQKRYDPNFKIEEIPLDDKKTFELLQNGDTLGVFQLESRGFRDILKRLKPDRFEDLIAIVALYRPGPIQSGMLESYVRRKRGEEEVQYIADNLEDILKETYGVIAYQEQVMQIASRLAGYTMGEADLLRRAMGKKKKELMAEQREKFIKKAKEVGTSPELAASVFDKIAPFAEYAFNKSHSAGYALMSYRTAYLKAHYPLEFFAANMTLELRAQDPQAKIQAFIKEARKKGIEVLPPDINASSYEFTVEGNAIRYGLAGIKNVGETAAKYIVKEREKNGAFKNFEDFIIRMGKRANKRVVEALIKAGVFDRFDPNRARVLKLYHERFAGKTNKVIQRSLFGDLLTVKQEEVPFTEEEKLTFEKEAFGFFFSGSPFKKFKFAQYLPNVQDFKLFDRLKFIGYLLERKDKKSRNKNVYAVLTVGLHGEEIEVMVFSSVLEKLKEGLKTDRFYIFDVDVKHESGGVRLIAREITPLDREKWSRRIKGVMLLIDEEEIKPEIIKVLKQKLSTQKNNLELYVKLNGSVFISRYFSLPPDAKLFEDIEKLNGIQRVMLLIT